MVFIVRLLFISWIRYQICMLSLYIFCNKLFIAHVGRQKEPILGYVPKNDEKKKFRQ